MFNLKVVYFTCFFALAYSSNIFNFEERPKPAILQEKLSLKHLKDAGNDTLDILKTRLLLLNLTVIETDWYSYIVLRNLVRDAESFISGFADEVRGTADYFQLQTVIAEQDYLGFNTTQFEKAVLCANDDTVYFYVGETFLKVYETSLKTLFQLAEIKLILHTAEPLRLLFNISENLMEEAENCDPNDETCIKTLAGNINDFYYPQVVAFRKTLTDNFLSELEANYTLGANIMLNYYGGNLTYACAGIYEDMLKCLASPESKDLSHSFIVKPEAPKIPFFLFRVLKNEIKFKV